MRRTLIVATALVVAGFSILYACHADRAIHTEISIHASPRAVWEVLTAVNDYPAWNPMIDRIVGDLREGNVIEVDQGMVFHPRVLVVDIDKELRWQGHVGLPGIFDGEHRFVLEAQGGYTRLIQSERFTGILTGRFTRGIIDATVEAMREMNRALKTRVETLANAARPDPDATRVIAPPPRRAAE